MSAPAGWYPDTQLADTQRYWDGRMWTQHVAPSAPMPPVETEEKLQIGGIVMAVIPVIGVIVGVIMIMQHKPRTGVAMIVVGLTSFVVMQGLSLLL